MSPKTVLKNNLREHLVRFWQLPPAKWFLVFSLVFGTAFAIITPPLASPDEYAHFQRAYQVSSGQVLPTKTSQGTGGFMPRNVQAFLLDSHNYRSLSLSKLKSYHYKSADKVFMRFENTALYSPVVYLPQATGILISRVVNLPILYGAYLARFSNVIAYAALMYLAIRLLPFGKWAAVVIGLLPMHIILSGTASADPVSIGVMVVTLATILRLRVLQRAVTNKERWLILALIIAIALVKPHLSLIISLFMIVPGRVYGDGKWRKLISLAIISIVALVVAGSWLVVAHLLSSPYGPLVVNTPVQAKFMLNHPITFLHVAYQTTLAGFSDIFVQQYMGSVGMLESWSPNWITHLYTAFLALTFFPLRAATGTLSKIEKLFVVVVLGGCCMVILALLYLSWTAPGDRVIGGLQSRYFTPLLFLFIPVVAVRHRATKPTDGSLNDWAYRLTPLAFLTYMLGLAIAWFY